MAQAMLTRCQTAAVPSTQQRAPAPARASATPMRSQSVRRAAFFGTSLPAARHGAVSAARAPQLVVRAGQQISADVEKPIGLTFKESKAKGGGLVVTAARGNAAAAGIKPGDTIIYASSFFGDELWPTDSKGLTQSALAACPSPVALVYVKGENNDVNVKRLPKKPAPKRFGRKLTEAQKQFATHICADCGWIYTAKKPFEELKPDFRCPQCNATKKRFARYDAEKDKKVGGTSDSLATGLTVVVGIGGIILLGIIGLTQ